MFSEPCGKTFRFLAVRAAKYFSAAGKTFPGRKVSNARTGVGIMNKGNTMNKMAKGALATGVGVALLLGGGGTLAVWNQSFASEAGTIASGDLNMTAGTAAAWTSNLQSAPIDVDDIADYKAIPGEELTYSQDLDVTLKGDHISANLTTTGAVAAAFAGQATVTTEYSLDNGATWVSSADALTPVQMDADGNKTIKARIVVDFVDNPNGNALASTNQSQDLSGVGFKLEQIAPGSN